MSATSNSEYHFRPFEGVGNNYEHPAYGRVGRDLLRKSVQGYNGGEWSLASNPNARRISNAICKGTSIPSERRLSNLTWVWSQFVDHQLDLTTQQEGTGAEAITIPLLDPSVDPNEDHYLPGRAIPFSRSKYTEVGGVRQQANDLTSYVDACNVYGTTPDMAFRLRAADGTGKMKTSMADNGEMLLPYNTVGLHMDVFGPMPQESLFAAGDIRANENIALIAMHTLWVREHNRLCDFIIEQHPEWAGQDEMIYQHARRIVIGMQQQITFNEVLPKLLGTVPTYSGYDTTVDASIATEFSTVGYRVGHTMLPETLQTSADDSDTVNLFEAFFNPAWVQANGINDLLVGLSKSIQQQVDNVVVDAVRNQLFGPPTTTVMRDLVAINIQRGRDHGIRGYNAVRQAYGLPSVTWDTMPITAELKTKLQSVYSDVDSIDPWVGCIVETRLPAAEVGPLLFAIISDQALRIRAGDRFWFERDPALSTSERVIIRSTRLSDVLTRNTGKAFPRDVFVVA